MVDLKFMTAGEYMDDGMINYPDITRLEVIDDGRELVKYDLKNVQISIQDDGRTMKIFVNKQTV
jgi:hypothetical protein|tara:strand:+ start:739 stop:930 length:192 start_codon:yes stop_codon:yes gene_type:complete